MTKFTLFLGLLSFALPFAPFSFGLIGMVFTAYTDQSKSFTGQSITRTATIHLDGPIAKVFQLFEPVGEKAAQEGMVFLTYDDKGKNESYWTMIEYDARQHRIAYINVIPNYQVRKIAIQCREVGAGKTDATVSYSYTGTTPHGNDDAAKQTEESYTAKMQHWAHAINTYLTTGKQIEMH